MKTFTIADIRALNPCYNPNLYLAENWEGNALDILKHAAIPAKDKLWVVLCEDILNDKILRLFAVSCVRSVEHLMKNECSIYAINVAEQYALGTATKEELNTAYNAAVAYAAVVADVAAAAYTTYARAAYAADDAAYAAAYAADDADAARTQQVIELINLIEKE